MTERFFSCDWGTTSFRLKLIAVPTRQVLAQVANDGGVKNLNLRLGDQAGPAERACAFERHLAAAIEQVDSGPNPAPPDCPVVVSGMASSSVGWREVPYASMPFAINGSNARIERLLLSLPPGRPRPVLLVSGAATETDLMRGEETQLIGLLALPDFSAFAADCVVVLPGTHSKHIRVRARQAIGFQTYMTGELYQILCDHSILRFTTRADSEVVLEREFLEGVRAASKPGLLRALFQVRARGVRQGQSDAANRSFLCGLLIGAEMLDLARDLDRNTRVLFATAMARQYLAAAALTGIAAQCAGVEESSLDRMTIEGHALLLQQSAA